MLHRKPTPGAQRGIPKAILKVRPTEMYGSQERWGGNLIGFAPTANWWWLVPATSSAGSLLDSPAFCPVSSNWDGLREVLSQVCGLVEMAISEGQGWRDQG